MSNFPSIKSSARTNATSASTRAASRHSPGCVVEDRPDPRPTNLRHSSPVAMTDGTQGVEAVQLSNAADLLTGFGVRVLGRAQNKRATAPLPDVRSGRRLTSGLRHPGPPRASERARRGVRPSSRPGASDRNERHSREIRQQNSKLRFYPERSVPHEPRPPDLPDGLDHDASSLTQQGRRSDNRASSASPLSPCLALLAQVVAVQLGRNLTAICATDDLCELSVSLYSLTQIDVLILHRRAHQRTHLCVQC